ncbi:endonuclease/exonuclease/phosphatase family protein [Kocuria turfanensis]|uniref:endonuclease/exonuclease/phosphatase family protein n=1 Tax=Kocuria turfanensis TaxID=388357 RepID=UPI00403684F4
MPNNLGLWHIYPVVQLNAAPLLWIIVLLLFLALSGAVLLRDTAGSDRRRTALVTIGLLLTCAFLIETSQFARAGGFRPAASAGVTGDSGDLTVLSFNARATDAVDIVHAAMVTRADALLLVEITAEDAEEVGRQLHREKGGNQVFTGSGGAPGRGDEVAIITTDRSGEYEQVTGPDLSFGGLTVARADKPSGVTRANTGITPRFTAVHAPSPVPWEVPSGSWREQLQTAVDACREDGAIVGGDFNAVSSQIARVMGGACANAAAYLGRGAVGTWPVGLPAPFGAAIDHQLVDRTHWTPVGVQYLHVGGSDHRAVSVSYRATLS